MAKSKKETIVNENVTENVILTATLDAQIEETSEKITEETLPETKKQEHTECACEQCLVQKVTYEQTLAKYVNEIKQYKNIVDRTSKELIKEKDKMRKLRQMTPAQQIVALRNSY